MGSKVMNASVGICAYSQLSKQRMSLKSTRISGTKGGDDCGKACVICAGEPSEEQGEERVQLNHGEVW